MKNQTLKALELFLSYLDKHRIQGRILFFNFSLSFVILSIIIGVYLGRVFADLITHSNL
jgi:hypothetical protein